MKAACPTGRRTSPAMAALNYGSAVEMTFRNGKLKVFNDVQFGVQTGDPRTWTSYDQVWNAFCAQVRHLAWHALIQQHVAMKIKPQYFAAPATSMLHDLAMDRVPRPAHARRLFARRD